MSHKPDWILFYKDGAEFSSNDGKPWDAPRTGVIVLVQENAAGNWVVYARDTAYAWGWRSESEWVPVDLVGIVDYSFNHRGENALVFGSWTSDINFNEIVTNIENHVDDEFQKVWLDANKKWRALANGLK